MAARIALTFGLFFMWFVTLSATSPATSTAPGMGMQSTYVRICKNSRGMRDRRACRHTSREDPRRTALAFNY